MHNWLQIIDLYEYEFIFIPDFFSWNTGQPAKLFTTHHISSEDVKSCLWLNYKYKKEETLKSGLYGLYKI